MLGYLLDADWGLGKAERGIGPTRLRLGGAVRSGMMQVEWWDADRGERLNQQEFRHDGGACDITTPAFRRHLAFKLMRCD
jgi:hypothetical protein